MVQLRDYRLGPESIAAAQAQGSASPAWFRPQVDPQEIRALMQKSDWIAGRDTLIWIGAMVGFCSIAIALWPSWWSTLFWLAYGVLYGSGGGQSLARMRPQDRLLNSLDEHAGVPLQIAPCTQLKSSLNSSRAKRKLRVNRTDTMLMHSSYHAGFAR